MCEEHLKVKGAEKKVSTFNIISLVPDMCQRSCKNNRKSLKKYIILKSNISTPKYICICSCAQGKADSSVLMS